MRQGIHSLSDCGINLKIMEDAAKWLATGLENQGTGNCKGSIPSSSFFHQKSKSETPC